MPHLKSTMPQGTCRVHVTYRQVKNWQRYGGGGIGGRGGAGSSINDGFAGGDGRTFGGGIKGFQFLRAEEL